MGIPSFFRTLVKKYPDIHYWNDNLDVEHLYLDFNCLIHHCKANYKPSENTPPRQMEEELITNIVNYTCHIVCDIVKPKKLVYIAIDGPVPMPKLLKQRARRYKKIQDTQYKRKLHEKYDLKYFENFEGNKITPGTTFMSKLCSRLKNFIMLETFGNHLPFKKGKFNVFLSDANIAGEGEQKIFEFIKNNKGNPSCVIYGLDADLIVLSMKLQKNEIKLLRETQETTTDICSQHSSEFIYIDIDQLKYQLLKENDLVMYNNNSIINDLNALFFFGGNDFIDPFVHTKMKDGGLDKLIVAYKKVITSKNNWHLVTDKNTINFDFLKTLCYHLQQIEDLSVKSSLSNLSSRPLILNKKMKKEELIDNSMNNYEHSYYSSTQNPFHDYYSQVLSSIDYSSPDWKSQYNSFYFQNLNIDDVCFEYLKSIQWNLEYYESNSPPSWLYYYPFKNSPLASDLFNYLSSQIKIPKFSFQIDTPLCPFVQLLIVLPYQNINLLPFAYSKLILDPESDFAEFYPKTFKLDVVKGFKNIYSEPILPHPCFDFISKLLLNIPLSEPEKVRNIIRTKPFFFRY